MEVWEAGCNHSEGVACRLLVLTQNAPTCPVRMKSSTNENWFKPGLTPTVTHTAFGLYGTDGAKRLKSYFCLQQKGHKTPQRSQNYIRTAAHNPEVGGSSPLPATNKPLKSHDFSGFLHFLLLFFLVYFCVYVLTHILTHTGNFSGKG